MKIKAFILLTSLVTSVSSNASSFSNKVIYGEDNRRDVYETANPEYLEYAQSTAAMIPQSKLKNLNDDEVEIESKPLAERGICASENFSYQPTAANCSGFLVGDDLLVTAGHCIKNTYDCSINAWVFDYKIDHAGQTSISVTKNSVFRCKEVLSQALENESKMDYALIRLDRKVEGRKPLKIRTSGKPSVGDALVVIGHPTGLPTKIADGAHVRRVNDVYFVANLDTYGGNSGSAVLNADTGVVEGILVRGEQDYIFNQQGGCQASNVFRENEGRGEDVTLITNVEKLGAYTMTKAQRLAMSIHYRLSQIFKK